MTYALFAIRGTGGNWTELFPRKESKMQHASLWENKAVVHILFGIFNLND